MVEWLSVIEVERGAFRWGEVGWVLEGGREVEGLMNECADRTNVEEEEGAKGRRSEKQTGQR